MLPTTPHAAMEATPRETRIKLKFVQARDVVLGDFVAVQAALEKSGHTVRLPVGTIASCPVKGAMMFVYGDGIRKYVQWLPRIINTFVFASNDAGSWANPMDTVVIPTNAPPPPHKWFPELVLTLVAPEARQWTAEEVADLEHAFVSTGAVRSVAIHNRQALSCAAPAVHHTDSQADINDFVGFDVPRAVQDWTIPHPGFPNAQRERLFYCFFCAQFKPHWNFTPRGLRAIDTFVSLLGVRVAGTNSACDGCITRVCAQKNHGVPLHQNV